MDQTGLQHDFPTVAVVREFTSEHVQLQRAARGGEQLQTSTNVVVRTAWVAIGALSGIVVVAIGLGALVAQFATPQTAFTVALSVTATVALISGVAAGPILRRLTRRQQSNDIRAAASHRQTTVDGDVPPGK